MPKPSSSSSRARKPRSTLERSGRKGAAVVYDPLAHAEYVTGFRKRKNARRLEAQAKAAEAEKVKRRENRKEKRDFIRESAQRMRGAPAGTNDDGQIDESQENVEETYDAGDTVVTATVSRMNTSADTSFIKSTLTSERREYSRSNPLPKDVNVARLAASVAESMKGKKKSGKSSAVAKQRRKRKPRTAGKK